MLCFFLDALFLLPFAATTATATAAAAAQHVLLLHSHYVSLGVGGRGDFRVLSEGLGFRVRV